jgi:hypothetical protein
MTWKGLLQWPWAAGGSETRDEDDHAPTRRQIILIVDYITLLIAVTVLVSTVTRHRFWSSAASHPDHAPTTSASR